VTGPGDILAQWEFHVEAGKVREFARAVHDAHAEDSVIAPPTFPMVASAEFTERMITMLLKADRARTVHGEQAFEYFRPIVAGDRLQCTARRAGDEMKQGKRGGAMRIVTTVIEYVSIEGGELVCRETMTTIEKAAAP
jgi:hypothetical protein